MLWEIQDNVLYRYNGDPDIKEITLPDDVELISWEMLAKSFHHLKIVHIMNRGYKKEFLSELEKIKEKHHL